LALIHLALGSKSAKSRLRVNAVIAAATISNPTLTNQIVREALATFLSRGLRGHQSTSADDIAVPWNNHAKLSALLLSAVSFSEETESFIREKSVVELIVLVHHRLICSCLAVRNCVITHCTDRSI